MASTTAAATADTHRGANRLIAGIVLAVITFWLFAQTMLNVAPTMREELRISESLNNIAVSITALFSGIFIVVAGGLADWLGRLKITYLGLALFLGRTDNIGIRFAAAVALLFNVMM
jgi:DHA2 family multidrug resistance protein-like MFS transporter